MIVHANRSWSLFVASERDPCELPQQHDYDQHDGDVAGCIEQHLGRADQ
jgi:hypothetical protein